MTTRIFRLTAASQAAASGETLALELDELMPDEGGEVVVLNRVGTDITVLTDDSVTARGMGARM